MKFIQFSNMIFSAFLIFSPAIYAGELTPPGAPASTMKTLDEVEARIPIHQDDLPLPINSKGSYYFAENLTYNVQNSNAITIGAVNVTIDMNGFSLAGPGKTAGSTGWGIYRTLEAWSYSTVFNGKISGFRDGGIYLGKYSNVSNVNSSWNGEYGIKVDEKSIVTNCVCVKNGAGDTESDAYGIYTEDYCVITGNVCCENAAGTAAGSKAYGIKAADKCTITGNSCSAQTAAAVNPCSAYGIWADSGNNVMGNTCSNNNGYSSYGINLRTSCLVKNNACRFNTAQRQAVGIFAADGSEVINNVCVGNKGTGTNANGYGIESLVSAYGMIIKGNTCYDNDGTGTGLACGIYVTYTSRVEGNHCSGSSGTDNDYGIYVYGDKSIIISNTAVENDSGDIYFSASAEDGYAAGNITSTAIVDDDGSNNIAGTTPSANATY